MSALKEAIQDYLALRRGLGFKLKKSETAGHRPSDSIWFLLNHASARFSGA